MEKKYFFGLQVIARKWAGMSYRHMIATILLAVCCVGSALSQTTFYSLTAAPPYDPTVPGNWNTATDGSGTAASSTDFTTSGNTWIVQSALSMGGDWTIAGNLSINSGGTLNDGGYTIYIGGNWTNNVGSSFTATGTVNDDGSAAQTIGGMAATTFNNFTYSGSGSLSFPVGTTTVSGAYTQTGSGTVYAAPTAATYALNITGNFTISNGVFDVVSNSGGNGTVGVGGSFSLSSTGKFIVADDDGTGVLNVMGTFGVSGTGSYPFIVVNTAAATGTVNTTGDVTVTTISGGLFGIHFQSPSATATTALATFNSVNVNLVGTGGSGVDLVGWGSGADATSNLYSVWNITGNLTISGSSPMTQSLGPTVAKGFVFDGTGTAGSPQILTFTNTAGAASLAACYVVNSGTYVQMGSGSSMVLGNNTSVPSTLTVNSGGTLDCSTSVISGGGTGGGVQVLSGGTIATASTGGLGTSITATGSAYSAGANYIFNGATTTPFPSSFGNPANVTANAAITLNASPTITGALTLNSGNLAIGSNTLTLDGTVSGMSGTNSITGSSSSNLTIGNGSTGSAGTLFFDQTTAGTTNNIGTFTNNTTGTTALGNALNVSTALALTEGTLADGGNVVTNNGNITGTGTESGAGGITMNGTSAQTISGATFTNLTINNSTGITLTGSATVNGTLTLSSGHLSLGAYNLLMGSSAGAIAGTLGTSNEIVESTVSGGVLMKQFATTGTYIFPVGGSSHYTPIAINVTAGTGTLSVAVNATKPSANANTTNYINRYWSVTPTGASGLSYTASGTFVSGDVVGTVADIATGTYTGSLPWIMGGVESGYTLPASAAVTATGTTIFTGINSIAGPTAVSSANVAICNGGSTTLSAASSTGDATLSYAWAPSSSLSTTVGATVTASPTSTTVYTLVVTDGNGFTAQTTTTVTVNAVPASITGNVPFCSYLGLADATSSGTWYTTMTSVATVASTGVVTAVSAGTALISYTLASGCTATVTATVLAAGVLPAISSISPLTGYGGSSVTISGSGFNAMAADDIVFFGANQASVTAATGTSITATLPVGATFSHVTVDNNTCGLTAFSYNYYLPSYNNSSNLSATLNTDAAVTIAAGTNPWGIALGDIDGDGKADIVVSNFGTNTISIYRNISSSGSITSGSFAAAVTYSLAASSSPEGVAIGDLDGDGKPDIVVANSGSTLNSVSVFYNQSTSGTIALGTRVDLSVGSSTVPQFVNIGDIDGDGKPDIMVSATGIDDFYVFRNISNVGALTASSFATVQAYSNSSGPTYGVAYGDIDGDGKPDFMAAVSGGPLVLSYRNLGSPGLMNSSTFSSYTSSSLPNSSTIRQVVMADLDGDGKADAIAVLNGGNEVAVLRNTSTSGSISFAAYQTFGTVSGPLKVSVGDMDGDGKPELIVTGGSVVSILRNTSSSGSISFAAHVDFSTGSSSTPYTVAVGDVDGDGLPDIVTADYGSGNISILRNDPLRAITGVTTVCAGSSTTLSEASTGGTWVSSSTSVAQVISTTGQVIGVSAGSAVISFVGTAGATFGSASVVTTTVTVNAASPIFAGQNVSIYSGSSTTLTANGATTYSWAPSTGLSATAGASVTANPTTTTVYTVSTTNSSGCTNNAGVTVTVYPTKPTISSGTTSCVGGQFTLSSTPPAYQITWQNSGVTVSTVTPTAAGAVIAAGSTTSGSSSTLLNNPYGVCLDLSGNLYVVDYGNQRVQKFPAGTTSGTAATTVAGGNGSGSAANQLSNPRSVAVDASGNIYVADYSNNRIQKWAPGATYGVTVAGSPTGTSGTTASLLKNPTDVCLDNSGNIYVADYSNNRIQEWTLGATTGTTVAGSSAGTSGNTALLLNEPEGVQVDGSGNIYIADYNNSRVQEWAPAATSGTTIASSPGLGGLPDRLFLAGNGNLYVSSSNTGKIFEWFPGAATFSTFSSEGTAMGGLCVDGTGDLFVAEPSHFYVAEHSATMTNTVTATSAGTFEATVTTAAGAVYTNTVTVNTNPSAIGGNTPVCQTFTVSLTDATTGGTWSSLLTSVATIAPSTGVFTGVGSGTSVISYTVATGCYATTVATVNASPAVITGNTTLSTAITTTLADATSGGTWTSATTAIGTVGASTGVVAPVTVGTDVISYTKSGCPALTDVTINTPQSGLAFNGTNNYVAVTPGVYFNGNFTIEAWVYPKGSSFPNWERILDFGNGSGSDNILLAVSYGTSGAPGFYVEGTQYQASTSLKLNAWNHVAATLSGTTATIYINGVASGTATFSTPPANVVRNYCYIGKSNWSGDPYADAIFDDIRIWNVARTQAQIQANMNCDVSQQTGLVAYYRFDEGTAGGNNTAITETPDYSGNGNCGVLETFTLTGTTSNYVTGAVGDCNPISMPLPAAITGNAAICPTTSVTLADAASGGTWSCGNTLVCTVSSAGVVSGVSAGTTNITYSVNCNIATTEVTVNAAPTVNSVSNETYCPNVTTTVVAFSSPESGATFTWTNNNTLTGLAASGTTNLPSFVTTNTGSTAIMGTIAVSATVNGCVGAATNFNISVNPNPDAITGTDTFCQSATTALADASSGGSWRSANTSVSTINSSGVASGVSAGTTLISYTLASTGCSISTTIDVLPLTSVSTFAMTAPDNCVGYGNTASVTSSLADGSYTVTYSLSGANSSGSNTATLVSASGTGTFAIPSTLLPTTGATTVTVTEVAGSGSSCPGVLTTGNTASFNVDPLPNVTSFTPAVTVACVAEGGTASITSSLTNTTYTIFYDLSGANSSTGNSAMMTTVSGNGTFTIPATLLTNTGSTTVTVTEVENTATTCSSNLTTGNTSVFTVNVLPDDITGITSVCYGLNTDMADYTTGGAWSSSNTALGTVNSSGIVGGVGVGSLTITYTSALGCIKTSTITVNALPATITGTMVVCAGGMTTLSDATIGGTWNSDNISVATVSTAGAITGVNDGTVTITYTSAVHCITTSEVTVNPIPAGITGPSAICYGLTGTMTDATTGGTWSSSNTAVATINTTTGVATGVMAGSATISYTAGTGCATGLTIGVNALPGTITGTTTICNGATTSLSDGSSGGSWSSSNTAVATVVSGTGTVSGAGSGSATISYILGTGCSAAATVIVNALPSTIMGSSTVCASATATLTDDTTGGTWSSSNTAVGTINATSGIFGGVSTGSVTVSYILGTGCYTTGNLTVLPIPAAIAGTLAVCTGQTTGLTDATGGGTWTSGTTGIATINAGTGLASGVSSGMAGITYALSTGCYNSGVITVEPLPSAIGGSTTVCSGSTVTLSDATGMGTWSSGSTSVATIDPSTGVLSGLSAGTSLISYALSTGCATTAVATVDGITGTSSVCVGSTGSLSSGTTGGTWSSSNTAVATVGTGGTVSGVAPGSAVISFTGYSGCTVTHTVTVVSGVTSITGITDICNSSVYTFTDATSGGSWSATGAATVGSGTGIVTGNLTGGATISYNLGSCYATKTVTVITAPAALSGSSNVCAGNGEMLTDGTTGGTWTSVATSVATVTSGGSVSGVVTGTSTISYTISDGCAATKVISVLSSPATITGVTNLCTGGTYAFSDGTTGGVWTSNDISAAVGTSSGIVSGELSGASVISYSLGGCSATYTVTVSQSPNPVYGTTTSCSGSTATFSDVTGSGTWSVSNTSVATIAAGVETGVAAGTVMISYTLSNGCSSVLNVTVNATPAAIAGTGLMCSGTTATFTDATSGGTWSINTISATVGSSSGIVSAQLAGGATVSYTMNGCTALQTMTVVSSPTYITGSATLCTGVPTTYSSTGSGTWSSSTTAAATINSSTGSATGVSAGSTALTFTNTYGCYYVKTVSVITSPAAVSGVATMCTGATATFSDGTTGGTWSGGGLYASVGSTGIVTGERSGSATISYKVSGCYSTYVTVINAGPAGITGSNGLCSGSTETLSDDTSGGTWTSETTSVATINSSTGYLTGVSAGTAVISYTVGDACAATDTITIVASPASIAGSGSVCAGDSYTYTDATTGGTWSANNGDVSIGSSTGVVTGISSGASVLTYSLVGCYSTLSVSVLSGPSSVTGVNLLCYGGSATYSDGTSGGTWSSSAPGILAIGGESGVASAEATGSANISYSLSSGCYATVAVSVHANPASISGTPSLCTGVPYTFSDATGGGTWSADNATVSVGSGSGLVTGVTTGSTTISYTVSGCYSLFIATITATPASVSGSSTLCGGYTTTYNDASGGGVWSSSNTGVATVNGGTGVVSGVVTGTSLISYTLSGGCSSAQLVSVTSSPSAISGTATICTGLGYTFSDGTPGGTWSSGGAAATVGSLTGVVTGILSGSTTVSYSVSGCASVYALTVSPTPASITGTGSVCTGVAATLSDAQSGGTWLSANTGVATINTGSGVLTTVSAGTTMITYTMPSGCLTSGVVTVVTSPAAISGSGLLCTGSDGTYTDGSTGGTWSSSNSFAAIDEYTGIATGEYAGASTISYSLSGCTATLALSVSPVPSGITGSGSVCAGSYVTLADATGGGTWSSANTGTGTIDAAAGTFGGVSAGAVMVTYQLASGCVSVATMTVVALPAAITGQATVCTGLTAAFTDATSGGAWSSSSSVATVDATSGVVTGASAGSSTISYTETGCTVTYTVAISPSPASIAGVMGLCAGSSTTLTDGTGSGTWSSNNTGVATIDASAGTLDGVSAGSAVISYIVTTGCYSVGVVTVTALPAAISGVANLCTGSGYTFTDVTSGGTWSSNTTNAGINATSGAVTGESAGTATISYVVNGCGVSYGMYVISSPSLITGTPATCSGYIQTMSDLTTGGTWSSVTTAVGTIDASTGVFGALSAGNTTVSYTVGTGCAATVTVTVSASPAAISGVAALCAGSSATFTDATGSGTWSAGNSDVTVNSGTGSITGEYAGGSTISYTVSGCAAVYALTVNPLPAAISGLGSVCNGLTLALSDGLAGGTWSTSDALVGSINAGTGLLTGAGVGSATVTYTMASACFITGSFTVTASPAAISGTAIICTGSTYDFSDATGGGTWSSDGGSADIDATTGVLTGIYEGAANISYTVGGCGAGYAVNVSPTPDATGTALVCTGTPVTLAADITGGTWSSSTTAVATVDATTGVVTGVAAGTTTISYVLSTGCYATAVESVVASPAAISGIGVLCTGAGYTFTDATGGGVWSSGSSAAAVDSATGAVEGEYAGAALISYTVSGCSGTYTLSVASTPASISGTGIVCLGVNTTYTDASGGGTWLSSDGTIVTINNTSGVASGVSAGMALISYVLPTGCYDVVSVAVQASPAAISGTSIACEGVSATFTDATSGGSWSSNSTNATVNAATGVVSGVSSGTAGISYTVSGCSAVTTVSVAPVPSAISGSGSVCAGSSVIYTDVTGSGTWSSNDGTVATVNPGTGSVSGVGAGSTTISYTVSSGCYVTAGIAVNAVPAAISGSAVVCTSAGSAFTDATMGGVWTSSTGNASVGSSSGEVTGVSTGTANISYTLSGCSAVMGVTVSPSPAAVTGGGSVCVGAGVTLADATGSGTWASGNTAVATINTTTGALVGAGMGSVAISYILSSGCVSVVTETVNTYPASVSGPTGFCEGVSGSYTDATTGGAWSGTNSIISVGSTGTVTGLSGGTASISYTVSGCASTYVVSVTASPAAIGGTGGLCAGNMATLTDATSGGTWSSSNTAAITIGAGTGTVSAVAPGTSTITYAAGSTGCSSVKVLAVYSALASVSGSSSVCVGAATSYTDGDAGGTWSVSNGAAAIDATSGSLTGELSGTLVVSYSLSGCYSTTTVTVLSAPAAITGSSTVCAGGTATLGEGISGGTWSSSITGVATVGATGIVTGMAVGTSAISYALSTGCAAVDVVSVITAPAAISGTTNLCVGDSYTFTDGTGGGSWTSGGTAASVISTSGVVTGQVAGTTTISYTGGGCSATYPVIVSASPAAVTGSSAMCTSGSVTLGDATGGGTWTSSNAAVATVISGTGVVSGVAAGSASISYNTSAGCFAIRVVTVTTSPGAISGSATACTGNTYTYTDATGGGTWSAATGAASINSSTGVLTASLGGGETITYTLSGCWATLPITVSASPAAVSGATGVCTGSTSSFSDGTTGGVWSSNNTAVATVNSSGVVSGVLSGTAIISYTVGGACAAIKSVTVTTAPGVITGVSSLCNGYTYAFSDGASGGTWSSSSGSASVVASTGVVTGNLGGVSTISYQLNGCYATYAVTVNSTPGAITGSGGLCTGSAATFSDGTTGGTWGTGNASIATAGSLTGTVTGISTGSAIISYTLATGCFAYKAVTVNAGPSAIIGVSTVCAGISYTFTDGTSGGTWSSSTGSAAVGAGTGIVTGELGGGATISYNISGCTATRAVTVVASPAAITGASASCAGSTETLSDGTSGGTWSSSNTSIATVNASSGVLTGVSSGSATISYAVSGGCFALATAIINGLPAAITGNTGICPAGTETLGDATTGGTWSSRSTAIATVNSGTGAVTGVSAGTTTISYVVSGCAATATATVNASPTITGSGGLCTGTSYTFTDILTGGNWSSGSSSVATVSLGGSVTGAGAGSTQISYTATTGCVGVYGVTVNATPAAVSGVTNVCSSATSSYSDGTAGGAWSSSNTGVATINSSGTLTSVSAGVTNISYGLSGCYSVVTVSVSATTAAVSGAGSLCIGTGTTFTDATGGGSWTSGNTGVVTMGSSTGIATGMATGSALISYTTTTGCYAVKSVTVNVTPTAITGATAICTGTSATLSDGVAGGTWSSSTGAASVVAGTGVVTGNLSGAATISYAIGSCYATQAITVSSSPATVTGSSSVCVGIATTFTDGTSGGTWASSNTGVATVNSATGVVTGASAGSSVISYSVSGGCFASKTVAVNSSPSAITGVSYLCTGSNSTYTDAVSGGTWASSVIGVSINSGSGVATGQLAGGATISYDLGGCYATVAVTVNASPGAITGTSGACSGIAEPFTDGTTGGTWSSSNTAVVSVGSASGLVTGITAGSATISYSLSTGCSSSYGVTVNATPASISGFGTVCTGSSYTFSDASTGGIWSCSTIGTSIGSSSGIITGELGGAATVSYTVGGCYATYGVTVSATPGVVSGSSSVDVGSSTTLGDGTSGGSWSSNNVPVASVVSGSGASTTLTGVSVGTAVITYSLTSGCDATTTITVFPSGHRSSSTASLVLCAGSTAVLDGSGGMWLSNAPSVASVTAGTGVVTALAAGTATVTYTDNSGTVITSIVVNALPAIVEVTGGTGAYLVKSYGGAGQLAYQWTVNGMAIGGANSISYTPGSLAAGDTVGCIISADGCSSIDGYAVAVSGSKHTAQQAAGTADLKLLPIPNNGTFVVKGTIGNGNSVDVALRITDMLGAEVYETTVTATDGALQTSISLPLSLPNGLYILTAGAAANKQVFYFTIQR